jgi:hypothetical protein
VPIRIRLYELHSLSVLTHTAHICSFIFLRSTVAAVSSILVIFWSTVVTGCAPVIYNLGYIWYNTGKPTEGYIHISTESVVSIQLTTGTTPVDLYA